MLKYLFIGLVVIHGLIHLLGFVKAFQLAEISALTKPIGRPAGALWLLAAGLLLLAAISYLLRFPGWAFPALAAAILSQALIMSAWSDAKAGTIANVLILLVALPALGSYFFEKKTQADQEALFRSVPPPTGALLTAADIAHLPPIVRTWIQASGSLDKPRITSVRLRQSGQMRTRPDGKWMPFSAVQYISVPEPGFVWTSRVRMMPLVYLDGRDRFADGRGEMLIRLLSLLPVVHEKPGEKINTGAALRFLAEITWIPGAALHPDITWRTVDSLTAQATLTTPAGPVTGVFRYSDQGELISFEAERYYGGGPDATLHTWRGKSGAVKNFDGYRLPSRTEISWGLPEGDFTWLIVEIDSLEANKPERYAD